MFFSSSFFFLHHSRKKAGTGANVKKKLFICLKKSLGIYA
jgi:hypothetical protein